MRKIKVIAGPTLDKVQELVREWLEEGHEVKHIQIDLLPQQPPCECWQAIIMYWPSPEPKKLPKRECRVCDSKHQCSRYKAFLKKWSDMDKTETVVEM